jgi:hypothetical protein
MNDANPYTPSRASLDAQAEGLQQASGGTALWREGKLAVLLRPASLPQRCVKCNEAAQPPSKPRLVYWHHPALYLLLLLNILVYALVAAIVRRKVHVAPGLCTRHKRRRRRVIAAAWGGVALSILLLWSGVSGALDQGLATILSILLLLVSLIVAIAGSRIVYAGRIDDTYVRLKGCGAAFLASLPQLPGS